MLENDRTEYYKWVHRVQNLVPVLTSMFRELKMAAEGVSKSSCRLFATQFLEAISAREIRSLVYGYIIGRSTSIDIIPLNQERGSCSNSTEFGPYQVNFDWFKGTP
jgi:hypothetical protein